MWHSKGALGQGLAGTRWHSTTAGTKLREQQANRPRVQPAPACLPLPLLPLRGPMNSIATPSCYSNQENPPNDINARPTCFSRSSRSLARSSPRAAFSFSLQTTATGEQHSSIAATLDHSHAIA